MSSNILLSHSRSLKVIRNDTVEYSVCKSQSLLIFHFVPFLRYSALSVPLKLGVAGRSSSLKIAPNRPYTTFYLLVRQYKCSSIWYRFSVIWRWIMSWPWNLGFRSLNVIQTSTIWKLECGLLFAAHSNYGRLLDIRRDLENWIRGYSRSLKMAPFDWSYTIFYWSAVVNIALSCTFSELFDVE